MFHVTKVCDEEELIVLEKGQLVIEQLTRHCKDKGIMNASFTGIGAVDFIECGYYDINTKSYEFTTYDALYEVVSMTGNVMLRDEQPYLHLHAVFTDTDNRAFGGHVNEMRVGATLEVVLRTYKTSLHRDHDEDTGLHLVQGL